MFEEELFRLLALLERTGVWLSVLAWIAVAGGCMTMAFALRRERRCAIWTVSALVGAVALAANLTDYFITLHLSPDLGYEANPLWRNVMDRWGLQVAKAYGLSGKILVSLLAGQMFAFYLSNLQRLYPASADSLAQFLLRMGNRSRTAGQRVVALFTLFAFFFSGIQVFYFYISYLNWTGGADWLPSMPLAVLLLILAVALAFAAISYRTFLRRDSTGTRPGTPVPLVTDLPD
jgi:hypothetical protein